MVFSDSKHVKAVLAALIPGDEAQLFEAPRLIPKVDQGFTIRPRRIGVKVIAIPRDIESPRSGSSIRRYPNACMKAWNTPPVAI